ncbi:MAG: hypothetical protein V9G04_03780 [Nocardioides sp.]
MSTRHASSRSRGRAYAVVALVVSFVLVSVPAYANERPVGWEDPSAIDLSRVLMIFVLGPIGLALLIALGAAAPWLIRGEGLGSDPEKTDEWFGGPKGGAGELSGKQDASALESGGASGKY